MAAYSTDAFVKAYLRFAARYGHPLKLLPDEGSQLMKACREMEYSWIDVKRTLNQEFYVGSEHDAAPVGGHNQHGAVECSIQEIKKLFDTVFSSLKYKLDILSYESAFAFVSNDLNNMPVCVGANFKDLSELDILTPNRLILGRNNCRSMSSPCTVDCKSRMLEGIENVFQAWWQVWNYTKLSDFVLKPLKWFQSSPNLEVGDIVVFCKEGHEQKLGQTIWTVGRVVEANPSRTDGKVRQGRIEYKNSAEIRDGKALLCTTSRACVGQCAFSTEPGSVCNILRIHEDPWN
jgi:hypothetical protein